MYKTRKMTKEERKRWLKVWNSFLFHPIQLGLNIGFLIIIVFLTRLEYLYNINENLIKNTELGLGIKIGSAMILVIIIGYIIHSIFWTKLDKLLCKKGYSMDMPNDKGLHSENIEEYLFNRFNLVCNVKKPIVVEKKELSLSEYQIKFKKEFGGD